MSLKTKRIKRSNKRDYLTRKRKRTRKSSSGGPNYYNGIYTGIKGQCVEFVRRYLIINHDVTFSDVDSAFEIPDAQFTRLEGNPIKMENELKVGSIIVWSKNYEKNSPYGHVAIVSAITPTGITVKERNYNDNKFTRNIKQKDLKNVIILSLP
jgi:hypothetical protein